MEALQKPSNATDVKKTESGPAEVSGGVPEPISPYDRPDPDEIYRQDKQDAIDVRKDMLREAKDQIIHDKQSDKKRTVTDKISGVVTIGKTTVKAVAAQGHSVVEGAVRGAQAAKEQKMFNRAFKDLSGKEDVKASYHCKFVDGSEDTHSGDWFITDKSIAFVGAKIKERIPYDLLASFEPVGSPVRVHLYTTDKRVWQLIEVGANCPGHNDEPPYSVALTWLDHMWRRKTTVPNPAATYSTS
ncbi:hypothetical protein DIPPA_20227 [Diplonema papillatum]|nr:hypothetical protein DIPPA_20227 [Diplonema papillatum]|eukprot:gene10580-16270_t